MTRIVGTTCGWETGDINEVGVISQVNMTATAATATPTPRSGSYCAKFNATGSNSGFGNYSKMRISLASAISEVWSRFAVNLNITDTNAQINLHQDFDSAGGQQCYITWFASDGLIRAYRAGTLLGTSSVAIAATGALWRLIQIRHLVHSSTGVYELWIDNVQVVNFTGNTQATANANVQHFDLGHVRNGNGTFSVNNNQYVAIDDLALNNTSGSVNNGKPADAKVLMLRPTGAGSSTVLTRGGTDTGANWSQTSETPWSNAQYVQSANVGDRDLYATADLPITAVSVAMAELRMSAQNSDGTGGNLALTLKSGATVDEGTAPALTTTTAYYHRLLETDPATSAAWTLSALNAVEIGATVR